MQLNHYLKLTGLTSGEFAERLNVSVSAVRKWRLLTRIPRPEQIKKINRITKGAVSPIDWYNERY